MCTCFIRLHKDTFLGTDVKPLHQFRLLSGFSADGGEGGILINFEFLSPFLIHRNYSLPLARLGQIFFRTSAVLELAKHRLEELIIYTPWFEKSFFLTTFLISDFMQR